MSSSSAMQDAMQIDEAVLSRIQNISRIRKITDRSKWTMACGGYSDVFRACSHVDGHGDVDVAIKRFRSGDQALKKVSQSFGQHVFLSESSNSTSSCLRKSYTSGLN